VSNSVGSVLTQAGLEKSVGVISATYFKDPVDPQWQKDGEFKSYSDWFSKYYPEGDIKDVCNVAGYLIAQGVVHVLKACGDDLSRENVMKQMASIRDQQMPMMLPGVKWNTSATDYYLIESAQLARFDGKEWVRFGKIIGR
jgi:branched-chain amino acid transport system substrate-binding protein